MTTTQKTRWDRINNYCLADPDLFPIFYNKLKAENNWNDRFAIAVIEEYMRFLFLCTVMNTPTTPSEAVDEVWHLHLQFSKDYWNDLCPNILEMQLHHQPALAGEHQKTVEQYNNTLAAYYEYFNQIPPEEIWPKAEIRFKPKKITAINTDVNYILSKSAVRKTTILIILAIATVLGVTYNKEHLLMFLVFVSIVLWPRKKYENHATVGSSCGTGCSLGCGGGDGGCGSGGDGGCGGGCGGCS
jgi:hypothetical protein